MITLISPTDNATMSVLTSLQKEFIRRERPLKPWPEIHDITTVYPWLSEELIVSMNQTKPASVIFKWKSSDVTLPMKFELSLSPDFAPDEEVGSIATLSHIFASSEEADVFCLRGDNLLSGTTYYWRVSDAESCETRTFSTVYGEIRPVHVDGIINVRDMGGRVTSDGRRIKQRLVYRGSALNPLANSEECLGCDGIRVARQDLKIKTDLDLRADSVDMYRHSALGDDVKYVIVPFDAEGATLNDVGRGALVKALELFADENNYPIYFHCQQGADRTGTVAMYLDAILNMSTEDIYLNYNFTALAEDMRRNCYHQDGPVAFFEFLEETYPDLTLPQRLMANLRKSQISEETIQRIRDILLE